MVNKGSHFADFVRFRPHNYYSLHAHSTISAALMGGNFVLTVNQSHQTRNGDKFLHMWYRTEYFANSLFPYIIKEWNNLSPEIRKLVLHGVFKNSILKFVRLSPNSLFNVSDSLGIKLLYRLRLGWVILENINSKLSGHYKSTMFWQFRIRINYPFFYALAKLHGPS